MTGLKKLQKDFMDDCLSADEFLVGDELDTDKISAEGQMKIYRESVAGNIISAMKLTYPVVQNLVGEKFFRFACRQYIDKNPPKSADMAEYGSEFAEFLQGFEPTKELAYLPDIARLEWLFHQSALADDAESADWSKLSELPPEEVNDARISLHPSVKLFSSPHPVLKIWEMCQDGAENAEKLDLSKEQGAHVLLVRKDLKVDLYPVSASEIAFLQALESGEALYKAFEAAIEVENDPAIQGYLQKHIEIGSFTGF